MDKIGKYDPDEECKQLIQRIKKICETRGVSRYALAKSADVSKSALNELISGKTKPYVYTLYKICNALNVHIEELLCDKLDVKGNNLSSDEQEMLIIYRYLSEDKRNLLSIYINMLREYRN